jgi:hypothetical protein
LLSDADGLAATLDLPSIGCQLVLADVYETVIARVGNIQEEQHG